MNQVTTKFGKGGSYLAPALGESWAHACTNRIMLHWEDGVRVASLSKSPSRKPDTVPYQVLPEGIRGIFRKRTRSEIAE